MQEIWERIQAWCETYAPEILEGLNPGATEEELNRAEADFGVTFPADMRALYAIHNGQKGEDSPGLLDGGQFLSLSDMHDQWKVWQELLDGGDFDGITSEPPPGVRNDWWNIGWLPFTHDGGGNHWCIDTVPTPEGTVGQVIHMQHDDSDRTLGAPSLRVWLSTFADKLESGEYVYSPEEYYGVVARDDIFDEDEEWYGVGGKTR